MRCPARVPIGSPRGGIRFATLALGLIVWAACAGAQDTREAATRPDEFVYKIPPEGVPLETLARDAEAATGRTFIISDKSPLKGKIIRLAGEARVPKDQAFSLFQALFVTQGYALKPLGDVRNRIVVVESIDTAVDLRQRATFVPVDELDLYRHEVGTVVMTFFTLRYVQLQSVRAALSQILTSKTVEIVLDVPSGNALIVFGFAPTVFAIKQIIAAMDVPQPEADLHFELLTLKNGVAEEIEPIIQNLIESNAQGGAGQARAGGQPGGPPKPEPRIIADPRLNAIAVYAIRADLEEIRRLVAILDLEASVPGQNLHIYRLKHTNAEDIADVLTEALGGSTRGRSGAAGGGSRSGGEGFLGGQAQTSPRGQPSSSGSGTQDAVIVAEPLNNALLIRASRTRYEAILPLIEELDRKRPQVMIQGAVAELTDAQFKSIGSEIAAFEGGNANWRAGALTGFGLSRVEITAAGGPITGSGPGSGTGTGGGQGGPGNHLPPGAPPTISRIPTFPGRPLDNRGGIFGIFSDSLNVPILLSLLENGGRGNLLSAPLVIANDNSQSTIESGMSVATQGFQAGGETTAGNFGSATPDTFSFSGYQEAKTSLTISPHISNDDYVRLEVELLVEAFVGLDQRAATDSRAAASPPDKTSRKLVGSVTIRNGATVVVGGLVLDQDTSDRGTVPPFGDIPLIETLFSLKNRNRERATIYFFLTPTIISSFDTLDHVSYAKKLEIKKLQGPIRLIDPDFRPILLDDRWIGIDQIEASGNLDIPRYVSVVPLQECGPANTPARDAPNGSR